MGNGLQGQYFDTADLTNATLVRTDADVNFNWGTGSPESSISADTFSVRWSGQVEAQFTESHDFHVVANDGARLWVNGQLLIDSFEDATTNASGSIDLISGRRYDIQLEYREDTGNASVRLEWSSASQNRQVIPESVLFAGDRGEIGLQRYNNISGNTISSLTGNAQFPDQPAVVETRPSFESVSNIGSFFGQRMAGFLHPPETGPYTFYISGDQAAELWLSNSADPANRQRIAYLSSPSAVRGWDTYASQQSATVYLAAGQSYFIEALHKESTGADHLSVAWVRPGQSTPEVISGDYLSAEKPTVRGFAGDPNAAESASRAATYQITRTGPTTNPLVVNYRTSGSASNAIDYQPLIGSITIPAGSDSVTLNVTPNSDTIDEGDETVIVELLHSDRYEVGLKSERTFNAVILDDTEAPAGGASLWTRTSLPAFQFFGGTFTSVSDPTFGSVIQASIGNVANDFSAQLKQPIDASVVEGDILFAEFFVRSVGADDGFITTVFEQNGSPFTKSLLQGMTISDQWTRVQLPFSTIESYGVGEGAFLLFLGGRSQTLQFANFKLLNYGPSPEIANTDNFRLNNIGGNFGVEETVTTGIAPYATAFEVQTTTVPPAEWRIQAQLNNTVAVSAGDVLRYEFAIRSTAGANPQAVLALQETVNFSTLFSQNINLTSNWQTFSIDVPINLPFDANGLSTVFNVGQTLQTVQIADFTWTRVGAGVTIDDLPSQAPSTTYGGRAGDSNWRSSADERIESDRKSTATVNVVDVNGVALEGAVVSLRQNEHAFKFGSAISAFNNRLSSTPTATAQQYQDEINRLFNTVVVENAHKWPRFIEDRDRGLEATDFAVDNDLFLRGHNIIWPSRRNMPDSVWNEYDSRVASNGITAANNWLRSTINARFDDVLTTFDGQITEWDVVNEPFDNNDAINILGDQILVDWFQRVRDFDSDIKLTLNDYNIYTGNGGDVAHRANFEYWLGLLNNAGLLDVIGVQSHFSSNDLTDIDVLEGLITTYDNQFGQSQAITEFDVSTMDEQLQADYLRDYMTQSFSQSGVSEFLHWGFWEGAHFQPEAALYRLDFSAKPNGQAYEDLVFGNWWSDVRGTTANGSFSADVFQGEYDVVVQYAGQTYNAVMTVDDSGGSAVSLQLPVEAINTPATIVGRGISYGGSHGFAETEMPSSIEALLPGQAASQSNFTNYYLGLNRVVIEVAELASSAIDSSDFEFRVGNTADPSNWMLLSATSAIALPTVSVVAGVSGQPDKVILAWPDNAIENTWLQVTMKSNARTGLTVDDVFYLGNQIGDVNGDVNSQNQILVNSFDSTSTRLNQAPTATVGIDDPYDVDRNGRVNSFDVIRVLLNQSTGGLLMFTPPVSPPTAPVTLEPLPVIVAPENSVLLVETFELETSELETPMVEVPAVEVPPTEAIRAEEEVIVEVEAVSFPKAVEVLPDVLTFKPLSVEFVSDPQELDPQDPNTQADLSNPVLHQAPAVPALVYSQHVPLAPDFTAQTAADFDKKKTVANEAGQLTDTSNAIAATDSQLAGSQKLPIEEADEYFGSTDSDSDLDTALFEFPASDAEVSDAGKKIGSS